MSDTPITDAAASTSMFVDGEPVVEIKICRELERKLQKAQADVAAMREALNAIPFPCPCCSYATMHAGSCAIGSAISADAGRELLEELHRLRVDLKSAREEVERAKTDRNRAGVEERRKYLPKIQELTGELAKAYAEGYSDCADACQGSKDSRMIESQFSTSRAKKVMEGAI